MPEKLNRLLPAVNLVLVLALLAVVLMRGSGGNGSAVAPETMKEFAAELVNKGLYREAAAEYGRYLETGTVDADKRANVMYLMADVYMDKLRDYETALLWYLRLKNYHPGSDLVPEANKKIVACLEHLGRSLDARLALEDAASLEKRDDAAGTIVATVGSRKITDTEFARAMEQLPPQMKKMVETKDGRLNFLRQYIARDLVYNAARRMGLQDDPDVARQMADIRRELMVQAFMKKEAGSVPPPDDGALKMYYRANKDAYADPDTKQPVPFEQCRQRVAADVMRDRQQEAYAGMMERMLKAEDVMIYDDLVK